MTEFNQLHTGLFSASVTAFLLESYQNLIPDNTDATVILLAQIYHQLSNDTALTNLPSVAQALDANAFVPPTSALICNILWFLSLSLSLTAALSATLIQQWTRDYQLATVGREIPHQRARIIAYLYEGLSKFHMKSIVAAIPLLLHASLLLFFAGLVEFLQPVNPGISYLILGLLLLSAILYILITVLPVFYFDCPYRSPLTVVWWRLLSSLRLIKRKNSQGSLSVVPSNWSLDEVREWDAVGISYDRDERDLRAMCWTLESSPDDITLELFADIIPEVVAGFDYSAKLLCSRLLDREDPAMRLGFRLTQLLMTCTGGKINAAQAKRRCTSTLCAIWSLTMMTLPKPSWQQPSFLTRETLRFDEHSLRCMEVVRLYMPDIFPYCLSTATVVARSLLDVFDDHILRLETQLSNFTRTGSLPEQYQGIRQAQNEYRQRDPGTMLERLDKETWDFEQKLLDPKKSGSGILSASVYVSMDSILQHLQDLVIVVLKDYDAVDICYSYIDEILTKLNDVRTLLQEAGLLTMLNFVEHTLHSASLPYEAFNTTRRLYLRLNLDKPGTYLFSIQSQTRLVRHLDEALDRDRSQLSSLNSTNTPRLPEGIANMLLGLLRGITGPECISKAKGIVSAYIRMSTSQSTSTLESAQGALEMLNSLVLPDDYVGPKILDIFSEHVYSNTKLSRTETESTIRSSKEGDLG